MLALQVYADSTTKKLLADLTGRIAPSMGGGGLTFSTNGRGFAALNCPLVPMSLSEAFDYYDWPGTPHVVASDATAGTTWEGRLEDIDIVPGGVSLTAMGYQRAMSDVPYTALWSKTGSGDWRRVTADDAAFIDGRYEMDNNNRIYIAPRKGESYGNSSDPGGMTYVIPNASARNITNFGCNYSMLLPSGWVLKVFSYTDAFGSATALDSVTATGSAQTGSFSIALGTPAERLVVFIRNDSGSTSTITNETGVNYAKLTDIRMKTTTVGSVLASAIAAALAAAVNTANSGQLSADTLLIEATTTDLQDELYEDEYPSAILDRLGLLHNYEWGVWENRRLHFRTRGSGGRAWYVDVIQITDLQRSLENIRNSAYGIYKEAGGRKLRTANVGDENSQARYGIVRRGFISVQTTSLSEAQTHRSVYLDDRATRAARALFEFTRLFDAAGAEYPLYAIRAGDTVTMRNLPPTLSTEVDRIRTFVVGETEYDATAGTIAIAPEEPMPSLEQLVARRGAGLR